MKIRPKVVALLSTVFAALVLVEIGVGKALLLPRFQEIETGAALTAMTRIEHGMREALGGLQVSSTDWGNWAATYRFIQDHNATYATENLNLSAMKQLHLDRKSVV